MRIASSNRVAPTPVNSAVVTGWFQEWDKALGSEVVDLVRLRRAERRHEGVRIEQVALDESDAVDQVADALDVLRRCATRHPEHLVVLLEQELSEVGAVLASDARDQRPATRHWRHPTERPQAEPASSRCQRRRASSQARRSAHRAPIRAARGSSRRRRRAPAHRWRRA